MAIPLEELAPIDRSRRGPPPRVDYQGTAPVQSGPIGQTPFTPTPSLHAGNVEALVDNWETSELKGVLQIAHTAFDTAHRGLMDIDNARHQASKNQAWHPHQILINVAVFAEKTQTKITTAFDKAHKQLRTEAAAIEAQLASPMSAGAAGSVAQEIRAYVRALPAEERVKFVVDAIKERDVQSLAAVFGTKAYLSGIDPTMQKAWNRHWNEQAAPEVAKRLDVTVKALALLEDRGQLVFGQVTKALGASWEKVNRLRAANTEAEKALLFNEKE